MKKIYSFQKCFLLSIIFLLCNYYVQAQNIFPSSGSAGIGTTTPNASSILEMVSTSKGMLTPRMNKSQRDLIATPATGLLIYQTNSTPGFYYYDGSAWTAVTPKLKGWSLNGNLGTNPATNFIGTADAQPLVFKVNNTRAGYLDNINANTSFGYQALISNTGIDNTATGGFALALNTSGYYNTAAGALALYSNTDGLGNTANGTSALRSNTHGNNNTAMGLDALYTNTTGYSNLAMGAYSLFNNTTGAGNIANGDSVLYSNTAGSGNVASGNFALYANTTGNNNVASGGFALTNNTMGSYNIAIGLSALNNNVSGSNNVASGLDALTFNNSGYSNTASGNYSLYFSTEHDNTAVGYSALYNLYSGSNNTAIGSGANVNSVGGPFNNGTALGANSIITASNQVRIGNGSVTSIGGYQSWTTLPSDKRVKKNIKENVPGLAFINKLKPVTYNLDLNAIDNIVQRPVIKDKDGKITQPSQQELDSRKAKEQIVFTGFVAQDVAAAATSINYNFSGVDKPKNDKDIYGLRYSDFVMPLVKAVQELSRMNDDKDAKINDLETRLAKLEARMNGQQSTTKLPSASLAQNIPNPFSNTTTINYNLPPGFVSAQIFIMDKAGKVLKQINVLGSGNGSVQLNASTLSAGAYQYSLLIDGKLIDTKQMMLAK